MRSILALAIIGIVISRISTPFPQRQHLCNAENCQFCEDCAPVVLVAETKKCTPVVENSQSSKPGPMGYVPPSIEEREKTIKKIQEVQGISDKGEEYIRLRDVKGNIYTLTATDVGRLLKLLKEQPWTVK